MTDEQIDRPMVEVLSREAAMQNGTLSNQPFHSPTDVVIKFLEPENEIYTTVFNRNLQLGNIKIEDQLIMQHKAEGSKLLADVPDSQGAFLFGWMAGIGVHSINFKAVSSNSIDGFGRKSIISRINKQETRDNTPKGGVSSFFSKSSNESN